MANKLYNQLNPNASQNIKTKKKKTAAELFREVEENGGDARKVFLENAQDMGINPQEIIDYLKKIIPNNIG